MTLVPGHIKVNKRHGKLVNDKNGTLYSHNIGNATIQSLRD